jgi:hypothetical protein
LVTNPGLTNDARRWSNGSARLLARTLRADLIITVGHRPRFLGWRLGLERAPQILYCAPCPVWVYHEKPR